MTQTKEGWIWLFNAPKAHYFVNGESLCKRWMVFSMDAAEQGNDHSIDNCKACVKKLEKRNGTVNK